jgi:hypothetical protein
VEDARQVFENVVGTSGHFTNKISKIERGEAFCSGNNKMTTEIHPDRNRNVGSYRDRAFRPIKGNILSVGCLSVIVGFSPAAKYQHS